MKRSNHPNSARQRNDQGNGKISQSKLLVDPHAAPYQALGAIQLLLEAWNMAQAFRTTPWDFAVEIQVLRDAGLSASELRGLLQAGFCRHAVESTHPRSQRRQFR